MKWLTNIINSGVRSDQSIQDQRPIKLSNSIALILAGVNLILFFAIPANHNFSAFRETLLAVAILTFPIVLNHLNFYTISRLYLCWAPPVFYTWFMLITMQPSALVSVSTFDGLRFYLLAYSCIPYLVLERSRVFIFITGVIPCFACLVFPEILLDVLQINLGVDGVVVSDYELTPIRAFVSYLIINASCFSLRVLLEKGDKLNQKLVEEVVQKNQIIRQQKTEEVNQLNAQLRLNLQQVSEREFILNQSQKIAKVGSWDYMKESEFVFLSEEMYNIFGLERKPKFDIRDLDFILGKEQRDILVFMNGTLLKTGKPYELTLIFKTPLSHKKWVRVYAFPIEEDGRIIGVRGIGHDITIYKEAEEMLRANEQKYRSLFEQASDAIVITDSTGQIIEVNESMSQMVGYSMPELVRMNIADVMVHNADLDVAAQFQRISNGDQLYTQRQLKHRDGRIIDIEASAKTFSDNRIMAIARDITERKRSEEELLLSQANLNSTINNTEILIFSVDRNFRMITFNKPFSNYIRDIYGLEVKSGADIFKIEDETRTKIELEKWRQLLLRSLAGEIVNMEEMRHGRDFHYSLSPIIESGQVIGVSTFIEDVSERKRYIRELAETNRQLAETKLVALRSVMSPHFIFNVLSSIQFYIAKNDRQNAINYLSTFSKLIRSVLNHSVNNKVKLVDEIELLKNYVQLELTRFENKFDFVLDVDRVAEYDETEIPSLLIQPYVENAILHGLYNKREKGILWIRFIAEESALIVEIEDNGIGREEAMKIKHQSASRHKSMGLKLTEERLKLINQYKNTSFEVRDLTDDSGNAAGTLVRIRIE